MTDVHKRIATGAKVVQISGLAFLLWMALRKPKEQQQPRRLRVVQDAERAG